MMGTRRGGEPPIAITALSTEFSLGLARSRRLRQGFAVCTWPPFLSNQELSVLAAVHYKGPPRLSPVTTLPVSQSSPPPSLSLYCTVLYCHPHRRSSLLSSLLTRPACRPLLHCAPLRSALCTRHPARWTSHRLSPSPAYSLLLLLPAPPRLLLRSIPKYPPGRRPPASLLHLAAPACILSQPSAAPADLALPRHRHVRRPARLCSQIHPGLAEPPTLRCLPPSDSRCTKAPSSTSHRTPAGC